MTRDAQNSGGKPLLAPSWRETVLVFLVFFVVGGAPVPHVNETHYLAKAKHFWNPTWCAGDLFLESADPHWVFYATFGVLTKRFSQATVAWLGRIAAWLLLAWTWQKLSARVISGKYFSIITAALFVVLIEWCNFAGEWVVGGVESKCFAYGFVLWALAEVARGNWRSAWPLLGIASSWHVLVGGWSVVGLLVVWITEPLESRPRLRDNFPSLLLGGILALPGVIPGLLLSASAPANVAATANQIYVFERLPYHLAPLTLPAGELIGRAARFGILLAGFVWLQWLLPILATGNSRIALDRLQRFAAASIGIGFIGLLGEVLFWNDPGHAAGFLKYYWFRLADVAVPLAIALSCGSLMSQFSQGMPRVAKWASLLTATIPGVLILYVAINRWVDPAPPANSRVQNAQDWQSACLWIRQNTPQDALFLIPRSAQSFKWYAERPDLCNWKDVPQDPISLLEWKNRLLDVFSHVTEWGETSRDRRLGELGSRRLGELAEKYGIDYLLAEEYPPVELPVVYQNSSYIVYQPERAE